MLRKRTTWLVVASIAMTSMLLSGVAVATGPTGSVVSEVTGRDRCRTERASPLCRGRTRL